MATISKSSDAKALIEKGFSEEAVNEVLIYLINRDEVTQKAFNRISVLFAASLSQMKTLSDALGKIIQTSGLSASDLHEFQEGMEKADALMKKAKAKLKELAE